MSIPSEFSDAMTLGAARDRLRELVDDGHQCPCCKQFAKVYRRKIHARMAADLIKFWRTHGREWGHSTRTLGATAPDFTKLVYWDMIEAQPGERDDGSRRIGWWRVTDSGVSWIEGRSMVKRRVSIYDGRCLGFLGDPISIREALGDRFDYRELMEGA